ncbi:MAG: DNA polymerase II [Proteobacteria bacterium]|nr:DNA polymerase II [Pseudomonadota bacterium]
MHRGFILQPTYRVRRGRPVIQLFGRLEGDGAPPFLVEDDRFHPYFFMWPEHLDALAHEHDLTVERVPLVDLSGHPVAKVSAGVPGAVPPLRDRLQQRGAQVFEGDVRFAYRYLIDHNIRAAALIRGPAQQGPGPLLRFHNPELEPASFRPELSVLSIDLETSPDASAIFSAALAGTGVEEVHLISDRPVAGAVVHPDERALLKALLARIRQIDPDLIVGWNVVDFDLRVLDRRCHALGLPCHPGRTDEPIAFQQDRGFTRQSRASVPGRMVLDGIVLVRDAIRLEDYRLETVSRALLGRGKKINSEAPDAALEIERLFREDPEALVAYNLEDARLVLEILERESLLDLTLERSLLSGMQLDRVGASIASFDLVYLPELRRRGVVAPSVEIDRKTEPVRGGAVLDSEPGIFSNVAVFDFKSLYPSLIRTFNLDPLAYSRGRSEEDAITAPNGARFSRRDAILPDVVLGFMERREEARRRGAHHADQAIKIMMNSLFGVLGAAACRFFEPDVANAITGFGQQTLGWTREAFESEGVRVIYGDTDSVFVRLETRDAGAPARAEAEALRDQVGTRISTRVRDEYRVEPRLTLELERVFDRFFMPRVRGGKSGSKKRYAGWSEGRLEIVGLESVRRDWPPVARRLQEGMLTRLFQDEEVLPFVRELVAQLRAGELDEELVYVKRIRKGSLDRYTATTPPHIQAARKAGDALGTSRVIRYVITDGGPEPVLPGRPLPPAIDRSHYLEKVLRPLADAILPELDHSFDEALGLPRQMTLL